MLVNITRPDKKVRTFRERKPMSEYRLLIDGKMVPGD